MATILWAIMVAITMGQNLGFGIGTEVIRDQPFHARFERIQEGKRSDGRIYRNSRGVLRLEHSLKHPGLPEIVLVTLYDPEARTVTAFELASGAAVTELLKPGPIEEAGSSSIGPEAEADPLGIRLIEGLQCQGHHQSLPSGIDSEVWFSQALVLPMPVEKKLVADGEVVGLWRLFEVRLTEPDSTLFEAPR